MKAVLGHTGFIGSNIMRLIPEVTFISRHDLILQQSLELDELYIAVPGASKWQIDQNPDIDLENIKNILSHLRNVKAKRCTLFSTVDVYADKQFSDESSLVLSGLDYGSNRAFFEAELSHLYKDIKIRRLGGLFGVGLKKNVIYDAANLRIDQLQNYNQQSIFQYLEVGKSIMTGLSDIFADLQILNVVGPPISLNVLLPDYVEHFSPLSEIVSYDIRTLYNNDDCYFSNESEAVSDVSLFISKSVQNYV